MEETVVQNEDSDPQGPRRRRRRRRRRRGGGNRPGPTTGELEPMGGVVRLRQDGSGNLVTAERNFFLREGDPLIPREVIRKFDIPEGVAVEGKGHEAGNRRALAEVETIEGLPFEEYSKRQAFLDLISIDPDRRIQFETKKDELSGRVLDLLTPMGFGQRALIVSPPKAGKTTLLKIIARAVLTNHPGTPVFVLLVDERPEEVTDFRRSVGDLGATVVASTSDETPDKHVMLSEFIMERAKRIVETGRDVVVLCDSLTRMARAYNHMQKGNGRILSGGIDARTMEKPRRFFGAARNGENAGSLTVVATALVDTGSRMDEVIFQEFKGTGNTEIILDRKLFERRIFPCLDIPGSGTRKEEKLYSADELPKVRALRRALSVANPAEGLNLLLDKLPRFSTNMAFLRGLPSA